MESKNFSAIQIKTRWFGLKIYSDKPICNRSLLSPDIFTTASLRCIIFNLKSSNDVAKFTFQNEVITINEYDQCELYDLFDMIISEIKNMIDFQEIRMFMDQMDVLQDGEKSKYYNECYCLGCGHPSIYTTDQNIHKSTNDRLVSTFLEIRHIMDKLDMKISDYFNKKNKFTKRKTKLMKTCSAISLFFSIIQNTLQTNFDVDEMVGCLSITEWSASDVLWIDSSHGPLIPNPTNMFLDCVFRLAYAVLGEECISIHVERKNVKPAFAMVTFLLIGFCEELLKSG
ncbi:hypothetical protein THOM_1930 [Trachipleistophora hominis]|uniref:Uncharacterized protein n=1 Tax=Trachipleistophora hominis TaxID=72359 RepID=L7JUM6_TRAHO|nr:hypothetical protein THOM_1930 [Trachipleistophora hominis]